MRGKISGTPERPRLCVTRSNNNIYVQFVDDVAGQDNVVASSNKILSQTGDNVAGVAGAAAVAAVAAGAAVVARRRMQRR